MFILYLLLLIPILWIVIAKVILSKTITLLEAFSMMLITSMVMSAVYFAGLYTETLDTQVLNGLVTSKSSEHVSCRHSYECHCHNSCSGSGKSRSCSRVCDTCYEHSFDVDWDVHTSIGEWTIDTVDRQGLVEPPRWTSVKQDDPVSKTESYVNYVKAAPESLFNYSAEVLTAQGVLPEYPIDVYDYYKLNRFIPIGVNVPDADAWNHDIAYLSGQLGGSKQVNVVVVLAKKSTEMYAKAIQSKWIGGKKNDIVIVIGVPEYPKVSWVYVLSWSVNSMFQVKLRDDILGIGIVDRDKIINVARSDILKYHTRKPMADYKYLEDSIEPQTWVIVLSIIVSLLSLAGLTYVFHRHDLWEELLEVFTGSRRHRRRKFR